MKPRARLSLLVPLLIGANLLLTAFWGCSMIVDGNFIDPADAGYSCTGVHNGAICPGSEHEAERLICLFGECVESRCGDGFVDEEAGEECEANVNICDLRTCRFHCWEDSDCEEAELCMTPTRCEDHQCISIPAPGSRCFTDDLDFGDCGVGDEGGLGCLPIACNTDAECAGEGTCESGACEDSFCVEKVGTGCTLEDMTPGQCAPGFVCVPISEGD